MRGKSYLLIAVTSSEQYELFDLVGQACELLRTCHSCIALSPWDRMHCDAKVDVMEATFHILIFIIKLLCILRQNICSADGSAETQWNALLFTTYAQWLDNVMFVIFFNLWSWQAFCPVLYGLEVSLYSILFMCVTTSLFPRYRRHSISFQALMKYDFFCLILYHESNITTRIRSIATIFLEEH